LGGVDLKKATLADAKDIMARLLPRAFRRPATEAEIAGYVGLMKRVLDDIQSQRNYGQAEEIFRRIRGTFFNRGIVMQTLIVGTRIGPGDFYERMLDAGLVTKQIVMPAMGVDFEPTIPEFWDQEIFHDGGPCCMGFRDCPRDGSKLSPREFMELMRHQSGEETWAASYMQNPQANTMSTFSQYLDRCLDRDRDFGPLGRTA
jgi:hypothetical protein